MSRLSALLGLARSLAIYHGQPWKTARLRRLYAGLVKPGDLCFDIGAHVGNRARVLAGLGARVVALEPQPLFADLLAKILPAGAVLRREAVAATAGRMTLHVSSRHPTVSTLSRAFIDQVAPTGGFAGVAWDETVEVTVTTLDALIAAHGRPAFVKIDVEGMEAEILAGLSEPLPLLAVEYLPAALPLALACIDRLEALGRYRYARIEGETHRFMGPFRDATAMRAELAGLPPQAPSGDLYARLEGSSSNPGSQPMVTTRP